MPALPLGWFVALQLGGLALFVSLAVTGFSMFGGLGDVPDDRSNHARTTPTAGGLGIVAGVGAAVLVAASHRSLIFLQPGSAAKLATLLSLAFALSMLGLIDDRRVVPTKLKLALILAACVAGALAVGTVDKLPFQEDHIYLLWWSALGGTVLWLFVTTNAVNFIDGINGIMGGSLALASGVLCWLASQVGAPVAALMAGTLGAALLGFLPYNFRPKAGVFCGDCGSLPTGFLYAAAVLMLVSEQPELRLLYAGPLLILPILADVLLTLIRKPLANIPLTAPHSTHAYQRWARASGSHMLVSGSYVALGVAFATLVVFAFDRGTLGSMSGLALLSGLCIALYLFRISTLPPSPKQPKRPLKPLRKRG